MLKLNTVWIYNTGFIIVLRQGVWGFTLLVDFGFSVGAFAQIFHPLPEGQSGQTATPQTQASYSLH